MDPHASILLPDGSRVYISRELWAAYPNPVRSNKSIGLCRAFDCSFDAMHGARCGSALVPAILLGRVIQFSGQGPAHGAQSRPAGIFHSEHLHFPSIKMHLRVCRSVRRRSPFSPPPSVCPVVLRLASMRPSFTRGLVLRVVPGIRVTILFSAGLAHSILVYNSEIWPSESVPLEAIKSGYSEMMIHFHSIVGQGCKRNQFRESL